MSQKATIEWPAQFGGGSYDPLTQSFAQHSRGLTVHEPVFVPFA